MPQRKHQAGVTANGQKVGGQFAPGDPNPDGDSIAASADKPIADRVAATAERPLPAWNHYGWAYDPTGDALIDHDGYIDVGGLPEFADDERVFYDGGDRIVVEKQFDFTTLAPAGLSKEEKLAWCEENSAKFYSGGTADGGYYPIDEPDTWDTKWWGVRAEIGDIADDTEDQFGLPTAVELMDRIKSEDLVNRIRKLHNAGPAALNPRGTFPQG